jgi:SAM-dependent methyltransferase
MLDMGTGGGEALSGLPARAPRTIATEAWPPNLPVAGRRLLPLGVPVIQDEAARDNMDQNGANDGGRLPFRDGSLDLICNRHETFLALEVSRVLAPGGTFVTQQVDYHDNDDLAQVLGIETPEEPDSWIGLAERQVTEAGLVIEEAARADQRIRRHRSGCLLPEGRQLVNPGVQPREIPGPPPRPVRGRQRLAGRDQRAPVPSPRVQARLRRHGQPRSQTHSRE